MIYQRHKRYHKMLSNMLWYPRPYVTTPVLLSSRKVWNIYLIFAHVVCRHFESKFTTNHILSKQKQRVSQKALNEARFMVSLWSLINNTLLWVEACGCKIVNQLYISQTHLNIKNQRAICLITFVWFHRSYWPFHH